MGRRYCLLDTNFTRITSVEKKKRSIKTVIERWRMARVIKLFHKVMKLYNDFRAHEGMSSNTLWFIFFDILFFLGAQVFSPSFSHYFNTRFLFISKISSPYVRLARCHPHHVGVIFHTGIERAFNGRHTSSFRGMASHRHFSFLEFLTDPCDACTISRLSRDGEGRAYSRQKYPGGGI